MIVAKFGGGVLNGADGLRQACREIASLPRPAVIVVSAFADVTNRLEALAESAVERRGDAESLLRSLVEHHHAVADQTLSSAALARWRTRVEPLEARLAEITRGLDIVGELSDRTLDLVVSFGERLASALVLDAVCGDEPGTAELVSALDVMITDDAHRYARLDMELTAERVATHLRPAAERTGLAITEGYIGRTVSGQVSTMGRESSDFSATVLGQLLAASEVRIYTGVPGVLTADPRIIPDARTLATLGYRAARTLAELGAKVLHARTVGPVEAAAIPLVIRPIDGGGTRIGSGGDDGVSIAMLQRAALITVELPSSAASDAAFLAAVARRAPIVWSSRFHRRLQVVCERHVPIAPLVASHLGSGVVGTVTEAAVVSAVSARPFDAAGVARFFATLGDTMPLAVLGGVERHALSAVVDPTDAPRLVRALHDEFVPVAI